MNAELIAALEELENSHAFHLFCDKLANDWTVTVNDKMMKSEKIGAEDYARAKIYGALKEMPKKMRLVLMPKVQKEKQSNDIYQKDSSDA